MDKMVGNGESTKYGQMPLSQIQQDPFCRVRDETITPADENLESDKEG